MSETLEQTVPTDAAGSRLDKWLIHYHFSFHAAIADGTRCCSSE